MALAVGARRAELLALCWSDVDFTNGTVTISKAMSQITGAVPFVKGTKTGSTRAVTLSRPAIDALRRQRARHGRRQLSWPAGIVVAGQRQATEKLQAGPHYRHDPSDPIFTNEIGERLTPQAATTGFKKIAQQAKASSTRLHDLRHTAASLMLGDGTDVKTASTVLGHANANVTLAVYGHTPEGNMRAATERLGARLEKIRDAR